MKPYLKFKMCECKIICLHIIPKLESFDLGDWWDNTGLLFLPKVGVKRD